MNRSITLSFRSVDHSYWSEEFDTVKKAKEHFLWQMGTVYDIGSSYAVNTYGDLTCMIDGATWNELGLGD
tara:strand:- start:1396 stop:1605 length:210 start_codon:yes stop_codon:yes gene_type:complete